ncbi:phage tail spike protein [Pediococcus pentosaceus]|uniref:phage tail spike protein n=1 Tax=Pediococcus pentosaceus TaxID=1255 RepID=UPI003F23FB19
MNNNAILTILDQHLHIVGHLSNDGNGTPFYNDTFTRAIANEDSDISTDDVTDNQAYMTVAGNVNTKTWSHTLDQIVVPAGYQDSELITQGNSIAYQDPSNRRWYVMRLNTIQQEHDASGRVLITASGTNIAANDLSKKIPAAKSFSRLENSKEVIAALLANTGWSIDDNSEVFTSDSAFEIDGTSNAQSILQDLCTQYGFEIDAYVLLNDNGQIARKMIEFRKKFGEDEGRTVYYGDNIMDITREVVDTNLFTKLYIQDPDGKDTVKSANGGKNYIVDDEANDLYNPPIDGSERTYFEGMIQSQSIYSAEGLLSWAKTQMKIFNHPRMNYTITISPDFDADLGDTIRIIDYSMDPKLTVVARVIQKITSFSDPSQCQVVLGEFATVKVIIPGYISTLEDKINSQILKKINELRSGKKQAVVQLITPSGKSWSKEDSSKTIIARVFVDGTNLTSYLSKAAFVWTKTNAVTGVHDLVWEEKHKDDGYQVTLDDGDVGNITCTIEGDYLKDNAELSLSMTNTLFFDKKRVDLPKDHWGDPISGAFQYQWYDEVNQMLVTSVAYGDGIKGKGNRSNADDTKYHRFKLDGTYVDSMIVQGGGHGSSFGARLVDGVPEIWTLSTNTAGGNISLARFKWVPNTVINQSNGLEVLAKMPVLDGHWFRRIACDFEQGWVLSVMSSGPVEVLRVDDLLAGKWNPIYSFKIQQFGFNPVANTEPNFNTMQSNDIYFPYMFINSGDVNKKDPRILSCINVVTESEVFHIENQLDMFGSNWVDNYFEPETIGYYHDKNGAYVLQGFAMLAKENDTSYLHRTLFKTELSVRDDSGDKKNYIDKDISGKEENVA